MKAILKMALAAMPLMLVACDDDVKEPGKSPAGDGDGIQFTISAGNESRTMYADDWDPQNSKQDIYWGNYIAKKDQIKIFCKNAVNKQVATYEVNESPNSNSGSIKYLGAEGNGMQWGDPNLTYNFYAFYPADKAGNEFLNGTDNTIRATVAAGQSSTSYRAVIGEGSSQEVTNSLAKVLSNKNKDVSKKTTIYAQPDMSAAIMVAKNPVSGGAYGQPVTLHFNVLADVIDITLNGPVTPNALGGNENNEDISADFINIQTVTLEAVNAEGEIDDNRIISGSFDLDMSTGKATNITGASTVQLQTSARDLVGTDSTRVYPTLFARLDIPKGTTSLTPAQVTQLDKMRLRAFLIPGSVTNLNQLQVRVMTNCGEYVQRLGESTVNTVSGKIYPIKLGYFHTRGTDFDFARWIGQLNPNIYISELSIPGAWHASSTDNQGNVSLQDLYNAGARAFEVHTINGTIPYTDNTFKTELTPANAKDMQYYDQHLNASDNIETTVTGGNENTYWGTVYGTNKTVTQIRTISYQQLPKFALRLYRSRNISNSTDNPTESFSDAVINLAKVMNPDGLMFLEFGFEKGVNGGIERDISVPCKTVTTTQRRVKTGQDVTGTRYGSTTIWDTSKVFTDADAWETIAENEETYNRSMQITDEQFSWCIAVESCLNRLKKEVNEFKDGTKKHILYTAGVTAKTTIRDVQGQVIVKINTNGDSNEGLMDDGKNGIGWSGNTPALFSRWVDGSAKKPLTINLEWGRPVAPQPDYENFEGGDDTGAPTTDLRWCFSELDKIDSETTLLNRKNAIIEMNKLAYANYQGGKHRTFYETSIGGFYITQDAAGCQKLAQELNPYALDRILNPARNACPLGLVFMNYVIPPTGQEDTYKSKDLVRAIINNNAAFLLNRASNSTPGGTTGQSNLRQNTNSSFDNTTGTLSPLR